MYDFLGILFSSGCCKALTLSAIREADKGVYPYDYDRNFVVTSASSHSWKHQQGAPVYHTDKIWGEYLYRYKDGTWRVRSSSNGVDKRGIIKSVGTAPWVSSRQQPVAIWSLWRLEVCLHQGSVHQVQWHQGPLPCPVQLVSAARIIGSAGKIWRLYFLSVTFKKIVVAARCV